MNLTKRKPLKPFNRKLHICGKVWTYFVGKRDVVKVRDPEGTETFVLDCQDILGCNAYDIERAAWKRYLHIKPSHVKDYVVNHCMQGRLDAAQALKELEQIDNKRAVEYGQRIVTVYEGPTIAPEHKNEPLYRNAKKFVDYNTAFYGIFGYPLSQFWTNMREGFDTTKFNQIVLKTKRDPVLAIKERWGKKGAELYQTLCE